MGRTTDTGARSSGASRAIVFGVLLAGAVSCVAVAADWDSPVRVVVSLAFLLFGPGLVLAELLRVGDVALTLTIAFAASVATDTIVAIALVYSGRFSTGTGLAMIFVMTSVAAVAVERRR
jgi:hypothetical protein